MYRVIFAILLSMTCATRLAVGADISSWVETKAPLQVKKLKQHKSIALKSKKNNIKRQPSAVIPKKPEVAISISQPALPETTSVDLSWVLDPLVANADGGKNEGSASVTGNIVVDTPGTSCDPEMVIELEGHIIKTVDSTVRLDIQVGKIQRSVVWKADVIKSGKFNMTLKEKVEACVLGDYIPASVLAFVTKTGEGHAAMVSLEKITVRHSVTEIVGSQ
jgi:hypothetical protein